MAKKPLPLRIDEDLLVRVDAARGDVPRTRFVERALEAACDRAESEMTAARLLAQMREADDEGTLSPEVRASMVRLGELPADRPAGPPRQPLRVPGVKTARDLAMERQAALNKAKKS